MSREQWNEQAEFMREHSITEAGWTPDGNLTHAVRALDAGAEAPRPCEDEDEDDRIGFFCTREDANVLMSLVNNVAGNESAYRLYDLFEDAGCEVTHAVSEDSMGALRLTKIEEDD